MGSRSPHARDYVHWGEAKPREFHKRATCAQRARSGFWYSLSEREPPNAVVPIGHKRRPVAGLTEGVLVGDNFVEVSLNEGVPAETTAASVFSALAMLQYELLGRANFGQGLLKTQKYEIEDLLVLNPSTVPPASASAVQHAFMLLARRPPLMVYDEVSREDRRRFDEAFFEALGFVETTERRQMIDQLNDAVCRIVWRRMAKTNNSREAALTYDEWRAAGRPFGGAVDEADEEEA